MSSIIIFLNISTPFAASVPNNGVGYKGELFWGSIYTQLNVHFKLVNLWQDTNDDSESSNHYFID